MAHQRMDGVLVYDPGHDAFSCKKLRDLREGDLVVCSGDSVRVFPEEARRKKPQGDDGFAFMTNTVSSERSVESAVDQIAKEMRRIKDRGGKTVVVCGRWYPHRRFRSVGFAGASGFRAWLAQRQCDRGA